MDMKNLLYMLLIFANPIVALSIKKTKELPITAGKWNEYNPSLSQSPFGGSIEWLVYERLTDDSSFIMAKKFQRTTATWDTAEYTISRSSLFELQKYPYICGKGDYDIIAWQKWNGNAWNIYCSSYSSYSQTWSSPLPLTNDTLNSVNVRIQPIPPDSQFVIVWQNKNIFRFRTYPNNSVGTSDTMAVSNLDSTEYDFGTDLYSYTGAIIYTTKALIGNSQIVSQGFSLYQGLTLFVPDTTNLNRLVQQPRFVQYYTSNEEIVFQSIGLGLFSDIYLCKLNTYYGGSDYLPITNSIDAEAVYSNPRAYFYPVVTGHEHSVYKNDIVFYSVAAFECRTGFLPDTNGNSSLLIIGNFERDSVASTGYNRNVTIGSTQILLPGNSEVGIPVVWESNRDGVSHLYSLNAVTEIIESVSSNPETVKRFSLLQNYPNPFNPSTIISYQLPSNSLVTLKLFDALGRQIATLINAQQPAGSYSYKLSTLKLNLPSGIYFYQLRAGDVVKTNKMLLIK
jgi:Secretion system C-terminal sorting domain